MDTDQNSLEFLVDQTFQMNQVQTPEEVELVPEIPASPGVLYLIEKVKYVTQLKLSESPNLRKDFQDLLKAEHSIDNLNFYEVDTYADAQFLSKVFDKFKVMKKSLELDSHDYNQTWWGGTLNTGELFLSFGRQIYKDVEEKFELGPLGDSVLAKHYLELLAKKVDGLSIEDNGSFLALKIKNTDLEAKLKDFLLGSKDKVSLEFSNEDANGLDRLESLSIERYFSELSLVRNFWTVIYDQVGEKNPTLH